VHLPLFFDGAFLFQKMLESGDNQKKKLGFVRVSSKRVRSAQKAPLLPKDPQIVKSLIIACLYTISGL
jgi:hypothetical protein